LTQRGSWPTFSPNPSILLILLFYRGDWFEGELVICFIYLYIFIFLLHFFHTHLSRLASPVILACISSIMLITVLG
jgi:hypothetical protein